MEIYLEGIIVIVGNYGSGKTEVSINLAVYRKQMGVQVKMADLDLVNPYFRTREAITVLSQLGITVVVPPVQYLQADLPILTPEVKGLISQPSQLTLFDVGGDDVGATVLSSLSDAFKKKSIKMFQVVNPYRPFTDTLEGCCQIRKEIEAASRMHINGIIGNANLIDETTPNTIYEGYEFVKNLSDKTNLPLEFITVPSNLLKQLDLNKFSCPILPIDRQLVPPWKKAQEFTLGPKNWKCPVSNI